MRRLWGIRGPCVATLVLLVLSGVAASGCSGSLTERFNYRKYRDRCHGGFQLESSDVLSIQVWNEPNHSREQVLVRPDGRISLPLVGDIEAAGLTVHELQDRIRERLTKYLPSPRVDVSLTNARSYHFYVMGEVRRPGTFTEQATANVLQALALAGGFTSFAKRDQVTVIWKQPNQEIRFPFNYDEVLEGVRPEQNVALCRGDTVLVP